MMDWPRDDGEMAARIRGFDWAATPLGAIDGWPERLKSAIESMLASPLIASVACGPERTLLYNDQAAKLYGGLHPAALGRSLPDMFPASWSTIGPLYERAFAGETINALAQPLDTRGEGRLTDIFDAYLTPVRAADGTVLAVFMIGMEVSGRLAAEAALRESEARLSRELESSKRLQMVSTLLVADGRTDALFEQILDAAIAIMRADYGSMQTFDVERRQLRLVTSRNFHPDSVAYWQTVSAETGSSCGAALRHGGRVVIPDISSPDASLAAESRNQLLLSGIAAVQSTPLTARDGSLIGMISTHWKDVHTPSEGELRTLDILARQAADFFERKRVTEALRASEQRFQQFAGASSGGLWIRDAETLAMEYTSPAIARIYGVKPDAFMGEVKLWAAAILPEDRDIALQHLERARRGEAVVHEFRIRRDKDKSFRWIRDTDFPLLDERGRVQRIGGIAEDITESKLAVEHQGVLLAELQHRVRNIMAIMRSITTRTGERAESVADYANLMVGRLLALARVQALLTRAANVGVSIGTIVRDEIVAQAAHPDQYDIAGDDIELPPKAAEILTLAIHELATNAAKYGALSAPQGKVSVRWSIFDRAGTGWLGFDWVEQRPPSPPEPPPTAPRQRGFGTELIEGRIPYELGGRGSLVIDGAGATCRLEFPLATSASILETDAPQRAAVVGGTLDMKGETNLSGQRILVIEDDYYLATDTARALESVGAMVIGPCANEDAANEEIERSRPTAAVVDINLGSGPSFEMAATLRSHRVPFVFVTGYDDETIPGEFDDVARVQKPVELRQIVGAVAKALGVDA